MTPSNEQEGPAKALAQMLFFKDLAPDQIAYLAECSARVRFETGQYLCREGESADHFYIVQHGLVALELTKGDEGDFAFQSLQAGDILGWSWLVPPYQWRFNARAIEDTQVIAMDGRSLRAKCDENHELGYQLLGRLVQVMTQRLETTRHQLIANTRVQM